MNDDLIKAIRDGDKEIMKIFKDPFNHASKWISFLDEHFGPGSTLSINKVLNARDRWHSKSFQALYVACWIYQPVEKGSFMIKLTPEQQRSSSTSVGQLTSRKSSHLSEVASSARGGKGVLGNIGLSGSFGFIKGYDELLVQQEGNFLFLKMEGHPMLTPSHMVGWVKKALIDGKGLTANKDLKELAKSDKWGIEARGAENYSPAYGAFLKALGLEGKMVTVRQVFEELRKKEPGVKPPTELGDGGAKMIAYLRDLSVNHRFRQTDVGKAFMEARDDLVKIVRAMAQDDRRMQTGNEDGWGINRVFQEIRVAPATIDAELQRFYGQLKAGPELVTLTEL